MERLRRKYRMSEDALLMFTSNLVATMNRDLADLAAFGVTQQKIDDFEALGNELEVMPSDAYYLGDVMIATENKNVFRVDLNERIRLTSVRMAAAFGASSGRYAKLGIADLSRASDEVFLRRARQVQITATQYLVELAQFGMTQQMIDDLAAEAQEFEDALNAQDTAENTRSAKSDERIDLGNEIYDLAVRYCSFGKELYDGTNPAKYEDYVIYDTDAPPQTPPPAPTNLQYVNSEASWNAATGATSYRLRASPDPDASSFTTIYEGPATQAFLPEPLSGGLHLQADARNAAGFGDAAFITRVFSLDVPANFEYGSGELTWGTVVWANGYYVEQSQDQLDWTLIWNQNTPGMPHTLQPGMWYYRIRSGYGSVFSAWSSVLELNGPPT